MRWAIAVGVIALALAAAQPAVASCAAEPLDGAVESPISFVGTVLDARGGLASIAVESVWTGPDLAPTVWVQGGQEQPPFPMNLVAGVASSGDITWTVGGRYLVGSSSEDLRTNNCQASEITPQQVAAMAPEDARPPTAGGLAGAAPGLDPTVWLSALVIALLVGLAAVAAFLSRR